jgi:ABC-type transport system substrate-binding protein
MEHLQFREVYKPKLEELPDGSKRLKSGNFAISRGSWYGDYLDVTTFTDMFLPLSLNNSAVWVNQEYADLNEKARRTGDPQERLKLLAQAEQVFLDEAAILPLYHYTNRFVHRDDVTGISRSPRNMVIIKNVQTPRSTGPGAKRDAEPALAPPAQETAAARE